MTVHGVLKQSTYCYTTELGSSLSLFIFTLCFYFWNYSFQISTSIYGLYCATKFGDDWAYVILIYHQVVYVPCIVDISR